MHLVIVYRWKIMYCIFVCGLERCDTSSISMKASGYRDDILSFHPSDTCFLCVIVPDLSVEDCKQSFLPCHPCCFKS